MEKNLEIKLNKILDKVDKIDELSSKVNGLEKTLNGFVDFSSERFVKIEDKLNSIEEDIVAKKDLQNLRLDLVDRYANKEKVDNHEIRITNLEEKLV